MGIPVAGDLGKDPLEPYARKEATIHSDLTEYDIARKLSIGLLSLIYLLPAWVLAKVGIRQAQRLVSQGWDLSSCGHCEISFRFVEEVTIIYFRSESISKGIMPLCKKCFDALPIELIDWYIESLIHNWKRYYRDQQEHELREGESNAKIEARQMKANK